MFLLSSTFGVVSPHASLPHRSQICSTTGLSLVRPHNYGLPLLSDRRAVLLSAVTAAFAGPAATHARPVSFERSVKDAYAAFTKGDYVASEKLWARATEEFPDEALTWQNLMTVLIINASEQMTLGQLPTGEVVAE
jgi:hypothetical protein